MSTGAQSASAARQAIVVGAGAVGLASAFYLLRSGWRVTVIDPNPPASGASGGNAGLIAVSIVTPVAMPGTLAKVPAMLVDPESSLAIRWRYLPRLLPWLARFLIASRPGRVEGISEALAAMASRAHDAYAPLLKESGTQNLVRRQGVLVAMRREGTLRAQRRELELKRRLGVDFEILEAAEIRKLAPALAQDVRCGVFYRDVAHVIDPESFGQAIADHLAARGARFLREEVRGFEFGPQGVTALRTDAALRPLDIVVIAAGIWSKPLAAQLGSAIPLESERGYHVMLPRPAVMPALPVISGDLRFCMTPMAQGLRLAGTVEFAGLDAPPNPAHHALIIRHAKRLLPGLETEGAETWMGHRPSAPDSLPVIGAAPRHPNAYFAFGHGHVGLTFAAITGRAIAELANGEAPTLDLSPYRADRW